jgi:catechol 2,3-dioxygenase-like lactoylglutathione lyase family enzyme
MRIIVSAALTALALMACTPTMADTPPGIRGTDHVGVTVPDLDQATAFFTDVLGCQLAFTAGPFKSNDDWMQVHLNVDPKAEISRLRMLRCTTGSSIELFEYKASDQKPQPPRNSDVGGHHVAFYVDDMAQAVAYLKSKNVKMLGDPTPVGGGANAGETFLYFLAPWGMQLEFVSYPNGMAYEKESKFKLWTPKDPAN